MENDGDADPNSFRFALSGMRALLSKLRYWIYLRLLKIYFWAQKSALKKTINLRNICTLVLDFEVRAIDSSLLQIGEVESDDALVEYVSRILTQRQMIQGVEEVAHSRSELASKLIEFSRSKNNVREVIATFFLAEAYIALLLKDEGRRDICLNNAREFVADVQPLDVTGIYKTYAKVKKRYWVLRKELAERSAIKIDLSLSTVISLIGVASALLVIAGYLYTTILLGAFGIDSSFFFSLPDYLAASIEQIRHAAYPTVLGMAMFVLGIRVASTTSRMQLQAQRKQRTNEDKLMLTIMTMAAASVVWGAYKNVPSFSAMELLGVLISYWLAEKVSYMFFIKRLPAHISLAVILVFASHIGISLYQRIYDFKSGKLDENSSMQMSLKVPLSVADKSLVIITANNNFVFALSKESKSVFVIPRENVKSVEIK